MLDAFIGGGLTVLFHATTRVTVLRGTGIDAYGDEVDAQAPVAEAIPAHITEAGKVTQTVADGTPRIIRSYSCRLPGQHAVEVGDRLEDTSTGLLYQVDSVTRPTAGAPVRDIRLDLRRIS